ncbi:MAG: hypothetical protein ABWY47_02880 [Xanthobacteraceae bacterium]|jgi:hypothetical protein
MPVELLSEEERGFLQAALESVLSLADCRNILAPSIPAHLRSRLLDNGACQVLIRDAISICEADEYDSTPPAIAHFLAGVAPALQNPDWLQRLRARVSMPPQGSGDPYLDLVIRGDMPFLDRDPLRTAVRRLLNPDAPRPVLIVTGPRYCGKSWTANYIEHLCRCRRKKLRYCAFAVRDERDRPTVLQIARDYMTKLGGDPDALPPQQTNEKRWATELANSVWRQIIKASEGWDGTWILVLDGINKDRIDPEISQFVVQLAGNMTSGGVNMLRHRLVLCDFDEAAASPFRLNMRRISLDGVSRSDMRAELVRMLAGVGRPDAEILANTIIGELAGTLEDLRDVGTACGDILQSIAEGA